MMARQLTQVIQNLRRITLQDEASDSQLLDQFIEHQDESAFAALVQRYSPMVWGVCRRILAHYQDAEDAFQATCLVLDRKATLAKRLARRGVVLSGGALAAALSQNAASACAPSVLVSSTIKAATLTAAGKTVAAGIISPKAAALTEGVLKVMLLTKLKTVLTVLLVVGMVAFGGGLLSRHTAVGQPIQAERDGEKPVATKEGKNKQPGAKNSSIQWRTDYSQARKEAEDKKRPLMLWIFEAGSPACEKMERYVWADAETRALISDEYIPVKLDHLNPIGHALRVTDKSWTVLAAGPDGIILDTIWGYVEPNEFRERLGKAIRSLASSSTAATAWNRLGLKLEPAGAAEVARASKVLRGGMRVVKVRADSPAFAEKFQQGDILVGLHEWEILNHESVSITLNELNKNSMQSVRFLVVRGNQIVRGSLDLR